MIYPFDDKEYRNLQKELDLAKVFLKNAENEVKLLQDAVVFFRRES